MTGPLTEEVTEAIRLATSIGLTAAEASHLAAAGIRGPSALHGIIELYPSLIEGGASRRQAILTMAESLLPREEPVRSGRARVDCPHVQGDAYCTPRLRATSQALAASPATGGPAPRARLNGASVVLPAPSTWPPRDQRLRPTCIAHAVIAMLEQPRVTRGEPDLDLSEQWLFWAMKCVSPAGRASPDKHKLWHAVEALTDAGICTEADLPYDPTLPNPAWNPGPDPSAPVATVAFQSRWTGQRLYDDYPESCEPGAAARTLALLRADFPVAIAIPMMRDRSAAPGDNNWRSKTALLYGKVPDPIGDVVEDDGHAVCVVGFHPHPLEPRGGYFLIRNSWGTRFAQFPRDDIGDGVPVVGSSGYGWISASYLDSWCWELLALAPPDSCALRHEVAAPPTW